MKGENGERRQKSKLTKEDVKGFVTFFSGLIKRWLPAVLFAAGSHFHALK